MDKKTIHMFYKCGKEFVAPDPVYASNQESPMNCNTCTSCIDSSPMSSADRENQQPQPQSDAGNGSYGIATTRSQLAFCQPIQQKSTEYSLKHGSWRQKLPTLTEVDSISSEDSSDDNEVDESSWSDEQPTTVRRPSTERNSVDPDRLRLDQLSCQIEWLEQRKMDLEKYIERLEWKSSSLIPSSSSPSCQCQTVSKIDHSTELRSSHDSVKKVEAIEARNRELECKVDSLLDDAKINRLDYSKQLELKQKELETSEDICVKLREQNQKLCTDLLSCEQLKVSGEKEQNEKLNDSNKLLEEVETKYKAKIRVSDYQRSSLVEELKSRNEDYRVSVDECSRLKSQLSSTQSQVERLKKSIEDYKDEIEALKPCPVTDRTEDSTSTIKLEEELCQLKKDYQCLKEKCHIEQQAAVDENSRKFTHRIEAIKELHTTHQKVLLELLEKAESTVGCYKAKVCRLENELYYQETRLVERVKLDCSTQIGPSRANDKTCQPSWWSSPIELMIADGNMAPKSSTPPPPPRILLDKAEQCEISTKYDLDPGNSSSQFSCDCTSTNRTNDNSRSSVSSQSTVAQSSQTLTCYWPAVDQDNVLLPGLVKIVTAIIRHHNRESSQLAGVLKLDSHQVKLPTSLLRLVKAGQGCNCWLDQTRVGSCSCVRPVNQASCHGANSKLRCASKDHRAAMIRDWQSVVVEAISTSSAFIHELIDLVDVQEHKLSHQTVLIGQLKEYLTLHLTARPMGGSSSNNNNNPPVVDPISLTPLTTRSPTLDRTSVNSCTWGSFDRTLSRLSSLVTPTNAYEIVD